MDAMVREWLINMYTKEIEEVNATISNEHIWELGYEGELPNPHSGNIERLQEYRSELNRHLNAVGN